MHIAASTRSLWEMSFPAACLQIQELGFDKVEIWLNEEFDQLKPSAVAPDPEGSAGLLREASRLSPAAIFLESEVDIADFPGIIKFADQVLRGEPKRSRRRRRQLRKLSIPKARQRMDLSPWLNPSVLPLLDLQMK